MRRRVNLAFLMIIVAIIAVGLGLMRNPSDVAVSVCYGIMLVALSLGLVGSIVRREGTFIGFTLFGWLHAVLTFVPVDKLLDLPVIPSVGLIDAFVNRMFVLPPDPPSLPPNLSITMDGGLIEGNTFRSPTAEEQKTIDQIASWNQASSGISSHLIPNAQRIGSMAMTLLVAIIGALAGRLLDRQSRQTNESPSAPTSNPAG